MPGFFLALAAALGLAGCARPSSLDDRAPDFEAPDLQGRTFRLSELRGKAVLLDFWATWCGPCEETIPSLERLHEKYASGGLEVVGVSVDGAPKEVPRYVKAHGMRYRVLLDPDQRVMERYGVSSIPTSVLIDPQGRIAQRWLGFDALVLAEQEKSVRLLLERNAPAKTK